MPVFETDLTLPDRRQCKVRDTYTLPGAGPDGADAMLIVATDRLSAFDVVMPTPIGGKGVVLTEIAAFWLRWIEHQDLCHTHLLSTQAEQIPDEAFGGSTTRRELEGRITIGRRCRVIPVECVVRGYLEGSGWKEYQQNGRVCGIQLPERLTQCAELPAPIFTPATKAEEGHDENIGFDAACAHVESMGGRMLMETLRTRSLNIYTAAAAYARDHGLILADTKFEFGSHAGAEVVLGDEVMTPDSSRYWPADEYEPGRSQASFDKQFVRDWADATGWDHSPPAPVLPGEVIAQTRAKYLEAFERITGEAL